MEGQVIESKAANGLFVDARVKWGHPLSAALDAAGGSTEAIQGAVEWQRWIDGGLWVGGRAILTRDSISFKPNAMNAALHSGEIASSIALRDVNSVRVIKAPLTNIVEVTSASRLLKVRCFGAEKFAALIESTVAATHSD